MNMALIQKARWLFHRLPAPLRRRLIEARRRFRALSARTASQKRHLLESASLESWEGELLGRVSDRIHFNDDMYAGDADYFRVGLSAIRCIDEALGRRPGGGDVRRILDLPSGAGRVLRFLVQRFPNAGVTACDLQRPAVDFCVEAFGAEAAYSSPHLERLSLETRFDLIWCGSLVTHLDAADTLRLLRFFRRHLSPGGLLILTTHGEYVAQRMPRREFDYGLTPEQVLAIREQYARKGHGYVDYAGVSGYGVSLTSVDWIRSLAVDAVGLREVYLEPRGWDHHQDVFGFVPMDAGA